MAGCSPDRVPSGQTEAVVLVGGRGTRLRPLTIDTPKPMLPTAGVPFLLHLLARLRGAGVEHVVLATSYRPEVFARGIGDGAALGLRIDYVNEDEPLGTGGGIRNVARAARERTGRPGRHPEQRRAVRPRHRARRSPRTSPPAPTSACT